ncbi:hypothetical protein [Rhizobium wuzhouense]|uniref:hypothetical protein n=1 Tax=Rhizobium wuzhouense TaxID=1986026 RepID=UPI001403E36F|nr:hypothetical protein [Rhizobium wuzhouense]
MAISIVGTAVGTNTATPPAHQAGDAFVVFAFRDGSTTRPTPPADYLQAIGGGANTCSATVCGKYAASGSETVGTFTNATSLILIVLRGVDLTTLFGAVNLSTGSSTTITYPSLTPQRTDGSSWILCFAGHRSADVAITTVPSGLTELAAVSDATDEAAAFYLAGPTGNFTSRTASVGGTSSGWRSHSIEIRAAIATGSAALADEADAVSAGGVVSSSATVALADDADGVTAAGTAGATGTDVTGAAALVDSDDGISASGLVAVAGGSALLDGQDSASASGLSGVAGSAALIDGTDGVTSAGRVAAAGVATLSDGQDGVSAVGQAGLAGSAVLLDGTDGVASVGRLAVAGASAFLDGQDGVSASGSLGALGGTATITDADDGVSASGLVPASGVAELVDAVDGVGASGGVAVQASAALGDAEDATTGQGGASASGSAALVDDGDHVASSGAAPVSGAVVLADQNDAASSSGLTSAVSVKVIAFLARAPGAIVRRAIQPRVPQFSGKAQRPAVLTRTARAPQVLNFIARRRP